MKPKQKSNIFKKIILSIWIIIGIILAIWTLGWYLYAATSGELGQTLISVIFFAVGLKLSFIYGAITIISIIIYYLIKFFQKISLKHKFSGKVKKTK